MEELQDKMIEEREKNLLLLGEDERKKLPKLPKDLITEAKRIQKSSAKAGTGTPKKGVPVPTPPGTKKAPKGNQMTTRGTKRRTKGLEGEGYLKPGFQIPPPPGAKSIQKAIPKLFQKGTPKPRGQQSCKLS